MTTASILPLNPSDAGDLVEAIAPVQTAGLPAPPGLSERENANRAIVTSYGANIRHIPKPSEEVQLIATSSFGRNIQYIDNPSEKVQLNAIRSNSSAIEHITNPSELVQMAATSIDGETLQYIKNPALQVQINAVGHYGGAIRFIRYPSEEVQLLAVQHTGYNLARIRKPSLNTIAHAIARSPQIVFDDMLKEKITPEVLEKIQPGLALQVEHIKTLVDDQGARAELLAAVYTLTNGQGASQVNAGELPASVTGLMP